MSEKNSGLGSGIISVVAQAVSAVKTPVVPSNDFTSPSGGGGGQPLPLSGQAN